MNDTKTVVVLLSGGMDSVVALHHIHKEATVNATLSFHYGSKHNDREIPFAKKHSDALGVPHETIDLGFMNSCFSSALLKSGAPIPDGHYEAANMKQTVVPFRNGIMLSIAAGWAESQKCDGLVIAAHSGDHAIYPDCREDFMLAMGDAIAAGTYANISLIRPFIHLDKAAIAKRGSELGIDFRDTWSCYKGKNLHCGTCGTCVERIEAFELGGVPDPTDYETQC